MSVIGYIRVSSNKQTCEHQKFEISNFASRHQCEIDFWVQETISSRQPLNKRRLGTVLNKLKKGDILITCEISRLGRSMLEVMRILETCMSKSCQVWTIKENYHLGDDIQSKVLAFAFGLSAEIERNLISQRTKAAMHNLRTRGRRLGRPYGAETNKLWVPENLNKVREMLNLQLPRAHIARTFGVKEISLRRFLRYIQWTN